MGRRTNSRNSRPTRKSFDFDMAMRKGRCGKIRYATREDAELILAVARGKVADGVETRREQRVYACGNCHGFHLTSRPGWGDTPSHTR